MTSETYKSTWQKKKPTSDSTLPACFFQAVAGMSLSCMFPCGSSKSQYSGFCRMGLLSGFAAVFLLLQMGREWRQCNTRITKDAAEISQHKQQRRRQQATTIATTTTALAAVTMTIRSRTVTISDMTMEKWQATTEMTMTTTNDK